MSPAAPLSKLDKATDAFFDQVISGDSRALSVKLKKHRERLYKPEIKKTLRRFSSREATQFIGVTDSYLRLLASNGEIASSEKTATGRHLYTLEQIHAIRTHLAKAKPSYVPTRRLREHLQVVAVTNFKGGSGKTTTAAHLIQYFALHGYRVLAIDLDPQASLSTLFGYQPEYDIDNNETLYGAIRYDKDRRPIEEVIRKTYVAGADLIAANIELQEFEHDTARHAREREGRQFFTRIPRALADVQDEYDIVFVDCPPQLGFLTLSALCASTSFILTIHPQMLDVASMDQFLAMAGDLMAVIRKAGGTPRFDWMRYLITRYEPHDGPQAQVVAFLRSLFEERVMTSMMVKSTAVSDAGLSKLTLYEAEREKMHRNTYDRALEAMNAVNEEVEGLVKKAWGRVS